MDLRQVFAKNLRKLRHDRGLSQEELAHEAGINRSYMSKIEKGDTYIGLEIIGKLCEALQAQPSDFFELPRKSAKQRK